MKKFVIKATALAIGALVGGVAVASVDFSGTKTVTTGTFASELDYSKATGTAIVTGQKVTAKLGFGVSANQNRYIRVDFTGVTANSTTGWAAATVAPAAAFVSGNRVAGGAAGDSYVIFQVTGNATSGNNSDDKVQITFPALNTVAGNVTPTATYALYETAADAVAAKNALTIAKTGNLFSFGKGLDFTLTPGSATAIVADSFKKFTGSATTKTFGQVNYDVAVDADGNAVMNATAGGTALALSDLVKASTTFTLTGDFGAVNTTAPANGVFYADDDTCATNPVPLTVNAGKTSASVDVDTTALAGKYLCYTVTGSKAIPAQTINGALSVTPATGASTGSVAASAAGQIKRDGATLVAPFVTIHPDYLSRIVLTSGYAADAAVEANVIAEDGVSCTATLPYKTTIKAGKQLVINTKDICGATSTGATRFAVQVTVAAPANSINGAFNVMNFDQVTGKTNSLITYVMTAPGVAATQP